MGTRWGLNGGENRLLHLERKSSLYAKYQKQSFAFSPYTTISIPHVMRSCRFESPTPAYHTIAPNPERCPGITKSRPAFSPPALKFYY